MQAITCRNENVIAGCRNPDEAIGLTALQNIHDKLEIVQLNVDEEESVRKCFDRLNERGETIDRLYNNAGIIDWKI